MTIKHLKRCPNTIGNLRNMNLGHDEIPFYSHLIGKEMTIPGAIKDVNP